MPRRKSKNTPTTRSYRRIHPGAVHETILALEARIARYFPQSGLRKVAHELIAVSGDTTSRIVRIRRRSTAIRSVAWVLCIAIGVILLTIPFTMRPGKVETVAEGVQVLEAALSASFFIGACVLFLLTWESRMRHQRTMEAIHELRAMAHVVDMHQLTKDPPMLLGTDAPPCPPWRGAAGAADLYAVRAAALPRLLQRDARADQQGRGAVRAGHHRSPDHRRHR